MAFTEFTTANVEEKLNLTLAPADLFPAVAPCAPPAWLPDILSRMSQHIPAESEKARCETQIALILLAAAEAGSPPITVFSGEKLEVDAVKGLSGEFDFLLARTDPIPRIRAPLLMVAEAKKLDISGGLGQCIAQMEAARLFNQKAGNDLTVFGCVTTGELWQFLRHDVTTVALDTRRYAVQQLDLLLGVFHDILK